MPQDIPLFKENLQFTPGQPVTVASGSRAAANIYGNAAEFLGGIEEFSVNIYAEQQVNKVKRGEIAEEELPEPITVVGKKMRTAFAESQAIDTNIKISNAIQDIVNNRSLSPEGMQEALQNTAQNMVNNNIPEMADTITSNFARAGVSAIHKEANRRLAQQRALQNETQKAQLVFWEGEYKKAYVASQKSQSAAAELKKKMEFGPLREDEYLESYDKIDESANVRLANAQANIIKTINSRVASGSITPAMGEIYMKKMGEEARNEFLAFEATEKGLKVLDDVELGFDEKLAIAQKASNLAGMINAEEDRAEREFEEEQAKENNIALQTAQNLAKQGKTEDARKIIEGLSKKNEVIGSKDLMASINSVSEDIDFIAAAGGPANPEAFRKYERGLQTGEFANVEEIMQDAKQQGTQLNLDEIQKLEETSQTVIDSDLSSPQFSAIQKLVKLRLPDDEESPSEMARILHGAKKTERQKEIENARDRINDVLISGVLDRTLATPQQQRDFVENEIRRSKDQIYAPEFQTLKEAGLKPTSPPKDVKAYVDKVYGKTNPALAKQKFYKLIDAQAKARFMLDE